MAENNEILGRKVRELYPEIAEKLTVIAALSDLELITDIHDQYFSSEQSTKSKLIFVSVILNLYDPDVLSGWKRNLCKGVRHRLASMFCVSDTAISNNIQTVRNYYTIYRKFKTEVDYFSKEISKQYQEHGSEERQ